MLLVFEVVAGFVVRVLLGVDEADPLAFVLFLAVAAVFEVVEEEEAAAGRAEREEATAAFFFTQAGGWGALAAACRCIEYGTVSGGAQV